MASPPRRSHLRDADKFKAATGADRDVAIATLQANVAAYHEQNDLSKLRWGWWGERYLLLCAALPAVIHSGAVYLDSTFKFGWAIARTPGVYEGQELQIIAAVVGYTVIKSGFALELATFKLDAAQQYATERKVAESENRVAHAIEAVTDRLDRMTERLDRILDSTSNR